MPTSYVIFVSIGLSLILINLTGCEYLYRQDNINLVPGGIVEDAKKTGMAQKDPILSRRLHTQSYQYTSQCQ